MFSGWFGPDLRHGRRPAGGGGVVGYQAFAVVLRAIPSVLPWGRHPFKDTERLSGPSTSVCCSPPPPPGRRMALQFPSLRLGRAGEGGREEQSRLPDPRAAQTDGLRPVHRERRTKAGRHRSLDVRDVALLFPPPGALLKNGETKAPGDVPAGMGASGPWRAHVRFRHDTDVCRNRRAHARRGGAPKRKSEPNHPLNKARPQQTPTQPAPARRPASRAKPEAAPNPPTAAKPHSRRAPP